MNSRWTTASVKRDGQIVTIRPNTVGDLEILKCLGRYTLLTAEDIAALTGRSYGAIIARLNLLKREPNRLIQVHKTQTDSPRSFQWAAQALHLTPRGIAKLQDAGFEIVPREPSKHFLHAITEAQVAASFEIGARSKGLQHVSLTVPPVSVSFHYKGRKYDNHTIIPDGGPIGIGYAGDIWRFVLFETDCASEPLESSNRDRQSIESKFASYLTMIEARLFEQWKLPNITICFTTTTKTRMENMRDLLASMTTQYLNCFAFQQFGTILTDQPDDKGWAVSRPWARVKGSLNLGEP